MTLSYARFLGLLGYRVEIDGDNGRANIWQQVRGHFELVQTVELL